jgi:hypothetical protein
MVCPETGWGTPKYMVIADLPDLSIHMSDVADRVGDVTDRLRDLSETATKTASETAQTASKTAQTAAQKAQTASRSASSRARRVGRPPGRNLAGPMVVTGLGIGILLAVFLIFRSRRSTSNVGSASPSEAYART